MSNIVNDTSVSILLECNNGRVLLKRGEEAYVGRLGKSDLSPNISAYRVYIKVVPSGKIIPINTDLKTSLKISRYHLRIEFQGNLLLVEDCGMDDWLSKKRGTKAGTFINGRRITQEFFEINDLEELTISLGNVLDVHVIPLRGIMDEQKIIIEIISKLSNIIDICNINKKPKLNDILIHYNVIKDYLNIFKKIEAVNNFIKLIERTKLYYKNNTFENPVITDYDLIESIRYASKEVINKLRLLR